MREESFKFDINKVERDKLYPFTLLGERLYFRITKDGFLEVYGDGKYDNKKENLQR